MISKRNISLLTVIIILFVSGNIYADTMVAGLISETTTWTLAESTYVVTGNILVDEDVALTIEPGVTIQFSSGTYLRVAGALNAQGTSDKYITFTSTKNTPLPGDWKYIEFVDSSDDSNCILKYCEIKYAEYGVNLGDGTSPIIDNCIISSNSITGIYWDDNNICSPKISNNIISYNSSKGIRCYSGSPDISSNTITDNGSNGIDHGGMYIKSTSINILSNNKIQQNSGYGICCVNNTANISSNTISNNSTYGIWIKDVSSSVDISENLIINNSTGIYVEDTTDVDIIRNTITGNGSGIVCLKKPGKLAGNNIHGNSDYDVRSGVSFDIEIDAERNYWGTISTPVIAGNIYDISDAPFNVGEIDFIPVCNSTVSIYLEPPGKPYLSDSDSNYINSTQLNIVWQDSNGGVTYNVYISTDGGDYGFIDNSGVKSYEYTGKEGRSYRIRVAAKDNIGESYIAENSESITCDLSLPYSVDDLSAVMVDEDYVGLDWSVPVDTVSSVSKYYVYRSETSGKLGGRIKTVTSSKYNDKDTDLVNGIKYYYTVRPVDMAGNIRTTGNNQSSAKYNKTKIDPDEDLVITESDGLIVEIPAGTIDSETDIKITRPEESDLPESLYAPDIKGSPVIVKIKLSDGTIRLSKDITITLPYTNSDIKGLNEDNLKLFYYDADTKSWVLIKDSDVDTDDNTVTADVGHLTIFRIMELVLPSAAIGNLSNYPNPFKAGVEKTSIRYLLKEETDVKIVIYDLLGDVVSEYSINSGSQGAAAGVNEVIWDGKNGFGRYVDIGAYILTIESNGKELRRKMGVK